MIILKEENVLGVEAIKLRYGADRVTIELVDESDVKPSRETPRRIEGTGSKLRIVPKEDTKFCERIKKGMVNNCVLCRELDREVFDKCNNKFNYDDY